MWAECWPVWYFHITPPLVPDCTASHYGPDCAETCECENGAQCDRRNGRCSCLHSWVGLSCQEGIQKWLTRMHPCCVNYLPSPIHPQEQQVTSFADSRVRAEVTFWLTLWNKSQWLVSVLTAFTYCLHLGQNCRGCIFFGVVFALIVCISSGGPPRLTDSSSSRRDLQHNSL